MDGRRVAAALRLEGAEAGGSESSGGEGGLETDSGGPLSAPPGVLRPEQDPGGRRVRGNCSREKLVAITRH